jgi:hypothetical protein
MKSDPVHARPLLNSDINRPPAFTKFSRLKSSALQSRETDVHLSARRAINFNAGSAIGQHH